MIMLAHFLCESSANWCEMLQMETRPYKQDAQELD